MEKYYDPKTKKHQDLFETLNPVFQVSCKIPDIVIGNEGVEVKIVVEANNENEAINKVLLNQEFTKHLRMEKFETKYLEVYKPAGFYVIGRVNYYDNNQWM